MLFYLCLTILVPTYKIVLGDLNQFFQYEVKTTTRVGLPIGEPAC